MFAKNLIEQGKVALLLQAGGNGARLGLEELKPLVKLADNTTCLENILSSTPQEVPVFMHIQLEQKPRYQNYFASTPFPHKIYYLLQRHSIIKDEDGRPTAFVMPNGPGSFGKSLKNAVEINNLDIDYFATYDACKTGLDFDDVEKAVEELRETDSPALAYTKKPSFRQILEEAMLLLVRGTHPRFDRMKDGKLYEKRSLSLSRLHYPILTGLNVFDYPAFVKNLGNIRGSEIPVTFYYTDYRITDVLNLFGKILSPAQETHVLSLKFQGDLEKYAGLCQTKTL